MSSPVETFPAVLGPLTREQRSEIVGHAHPMQASARRTFRRLLMLAQDRGLTSDAIARTARQAHEHDA